MNEWMNEKNRWICERMNQWIDEWMNKWINKKSTSLSWLRICFCWSRMISCSFFCLASSSSNSAAAYSWEILLKGLFKDLKINKYHNFILMKTKLKDVPKGQLSFVSDYKIWALCAFLNGWTALLITPQITQIGQGRNLKMLNEIQSFWISK